MEDLITFTMISLQVLFWGGCFVLLICLIIRRIKIKETEDFEKRDN